MNKNWNFNKRNIKIISEPEIQSQKTVNISSVNRRIAVKGKNQAETE